MTYLDTNVLVDVLQPESEFYEWSKARLQEAKENGPVLVSDAVYSEFSVAFETIEEVDAVINQLDLVRCGYDDTALFDAGKAYLAYRNNAGEAAKKNVLPDFFIGAQANHTETQLLTRDANRMRHYFPNIALISP